MVRAVIYTETGPDSPWQYVENWTVPDRKPGEVKIAVKSTSYNPVDTKVKAGSRGPVTLPKVSGGDVAGVVVESDPGSEFKPGDQVFAFTTGSTAANPNGSWAEFTVVPEELLVRSPNTLSLEREAGAVPLVSVTAFQALNSANIKPGDRVLVHAGSGGVGHIAVQLAKQYWGAYIVSTSRQVDFVKSLGADEVIDYTNEDFAKVYQDQPRFSAIVDLVGGDTELKSYDLLTEDGTYAHIRNYGTDQARVEAGKNWTGRKYTFTIAKQSRKDLQIIADLIEKGKLNIKIAEIISLQEAVNAEKIANTKKAGKVLIQV